MSHRSSLLRPCVRAFTLIEMLVVLALVSLLISMIIPSFVKARQQAVIVQCATNQRGLANYFTMYYADARENIPTVQAPHNEGNTNAYFLGGNAIASLNTNGTMAQSCPDNPNPGSNFPRAYPIGMGWFFYQGYVDPLMQRGKLGVWTCPGAPNYTAPFWGMPIAQGRETTYGGFSAISTALYKRTLNTGVNPEGGNWHEVGYAPTGFAYRGRFKTSTVSGKKLHDWKPNDAMLICYEWTTSPSFGGFLDCHGEGLNILFYDGHVKFGGNRINGLEPYIYYGMTTNGQTLTAADGTAGTGAYSGYAYPGGNGTTNLWNYYSTFSSP